MQIKIHPLFLALALALIAFGQALNFAWTLVALALHELAHIAVARMRGYVVKSLSLLPYGAMMSMEENFDRTSAILIGLAGPVANLLAALITLGLWWLFPAAYPVTEFFFYANMSLGLFNLLPIYPLDGSRVMLGVSKNKLKAIRIMQIFGVACSIGLFAAFIATCFFDVNFTLGVLAVFLFYGSAFGCNDELYVSALDSSVKKYSIGVEKKRIVLSCDVPIARLFHHVGGNSDVTFEILDRQGRVAKLIDEGQLKDIARANRLSLPIGAALGIIPKAPSEESMALINKLKPKRRTKADIGR